MQMQTPPPATPYVLRPPAARARRIALVLSGIAVCFSIGFGVALRRALPLPKDGDDFILAMIAALTFLLFALLFRMFAAICELLWLERTWTNLPVELRSVGPVEKVTSGLVIGLSFVPGVSYVWKLGLVIGIADGFEEVRRAVPFKAPVPKRLGMAAVIVGWIPGLNVYLAPFLWEMFASRVEIVMNEILTAKAALAAS
jgi:hypothetical protein